MKIVYLAAGAAGMYCGSCLHDNTLAAALLELGHDVLLMPTYTPIRTDEEDVSRKRLFFGGINAYLQQKVTVHGLRKAALNTGWNVTWTTTSCASSTVTAQHFLP